jgi:hypothetical protein
LKPFYYDDVQVDPQQIANMDQQTNDMESIYSHYYKNKNKKLRTDLVFSCEI